MSIGPTGPKGGFGAQGFRGEKGSIGPTGPSIDPAIINSKAPLNNPKFTGTVQGISQTMVGLGNVDNTSDADKQISTATQNALDLKAPLANPAFSTDALINGLTVGRGGGNQPQNTAVGYRALNNINTVVNGYNNAFGVQSLEANTSGTYNVAVGNFTLISNTSGSYNTGVGIQAICANSTGLKNTAFGQKALFNTNNSNNTATGFQSGLTNVSGSNNTYIGYLADCFGNSSLTNSTAIGANAKVTKSQQIVLGNEYITEVSIPSPSARLLVGSRDVMTSIIKSINTDFF